MKFLLKIFLLNLFLLAGCNESKSVQAGKPDYAKPHAPVSLQFTADAKPQPGVNLRFELVLTADADADDMVVSVSADDSVLLLDYPQQRHLGVQKKNQQQKLVLLCQPQSAGMAYVTVVATLINNGQSQSRSFTLPVQTGEGDARKYLKSNGVVIEDATGERMISMPAEESGAPAK